MIKKVLVINKYHFISGGAERYFLSIMESLRKRGIEAIPLSIDYERTLDTPYRKYFPKPVGGGATAKIRNKRYVLADQWKLLRRAVWSDEASEAVRKIWFDHRPDLVYILNINNHLSPSVIDAAHACGMPVVMRMSDFNLVCASAMYFRAGKTCTACKDGLFNAVRHRCVHGSVVKSAAAAAATAWHRSTGVYRKVDAFVTPSRFMMNDLIEQGYPADRIRQINTFVAPNGIGEPDASNPYMLFHGRFEEYKGAGQAIAAFARSRSSKKIRFYLVGDENDAASEKLKKIAVSAGCSNVRFIPFERDKARILDWIRGSLFTTVPSTNFENLPHTILESFSCGKPVIATRLGSIPENVREGENGLLFDPGDLDGFARQIDRLAEDEELRRRMGERAYRDVIELYSEDAHVERVLELFESLVPGGQPARAEAAA